MTVQKKQGKTPTILRRSVTRNHWQAVLDRFPFLKDHREERLLFFWLESGLVRVDEKTGGILASWKYIAQLVGKEPSNYKVERILKSLKDNVLPELTWKRYDRETKECRVVTKTGVEEWAKQWLEDHSDDRVWIDTLRKVQTREVYAWHKEQKEIYKKKTYNTQDQKVMADYLHSLPLKLFLDLRDKNIGKAFEMAKGNEAILRQLHAFYDNPFPFYDLSAAEKTDRIYTPILQFLPKEYRQLLMPGCCEIDLQNCQLAVFAGRLGMPELLTILESGISIWPELLEGLAVCEDQQVQTKPEVKQALYSIMYGMAATYAQFSLQERLSKLDIHPEKRLIDLPLLKIIIEGMELVKAVIRKDGGMISAYGWRDYHEGENINSFYAGINQSFEQAIMGAVYQEVVALTKGENADAKIILHQHDGCTLLFGPKANKEAIFQRLQRAAMKKAREFDIPIFLTKE